MVRRLTMTGGGGAGPCEHLSWWVRRYPQSWLAGLLAALLFAVIAQVSQAKSTGPVLQFAEPEANFGTVMAGDLVVHDFVFTNTGDASLVLTGVYPTCDCTSINDWTKQVPPGQAGRVAVQFDSSRFNGRVTKTVIVFSNDPAHRNLQISFQATVQEPVELNPPMIILKPVIGDAAGAAGSTRIRNNLSESFNLSAPVCDNAAFAAELKTIIPGKEFQLKVHTVQAIQSAMFQGTVSLRTGSTRTPEVTVPILILPQPHLDFSPSVIILPREPLSAPTNTTVILQYFGQRPLIIASAKIDVPGAGVRVEETQAGRRFKFILDFPAGFQLPSNREATLNITTGNQDVPPIQVPLRPAPRAGGGAGMAPHRLIQGE